MKRDFDGLTAGGALVICAGTLSTIWKRLEDLEKDVMTVEKKAALWVAFDLMVEDMLAMVTMIWCLLSW